MNTKGTVCHPPMKISSSFRGKHQNHRHPGFCRFGGDRSLLLLRPQLLSGTKPRRGKASTLLNQAMQETGKIAIAQVMIRTKTVLACLRPWERLLVMETMFFPDEIRAPELLTSEFKAVELHPNEVSMANSLIGNLSTSFDPGKYTNEYRSKLMEVIQAKIAGGGSGGPNRPGDGKSS